MFNYQQDPSRSSIFQGTPIAANAFGKAEVEYQDGNAQISMKVDDLPAPTTLGPYTTYVLWALTPGRRAVNQGVLASAGGKAEMETSYGSSQFALIVTAEPHFAVSVPSTMITLYNVADDVKADVTRVTTLTERADYSRLNPIAGGDDKENPTELVQARYSVEIARAAGAERYARRRGHRRPELDRSGKRVHGQQERPQGRLGRGARCSRRRRGCAARRSARARHKPKPKGRLLRLRQPRPLP